MVLAAGLPDLGQKWPGLEQFGFGFLQSGLALLVGEALPAALATGEGLASRQKWPVASWGEARAVSVRPSLFLSC